MPVSEHDKQSPLYEEGVSCPHCHGLHTPERIERFRERQKQIQLARSRNERHIGVIMPGAPRTKAVPETAD